MNGVISKSGSPSTNIVVISISRDTAFTKTSFEKTNTTKKIDSININNPARNVNKKINLKIRLELKISLAADNIESTGGTLALFILIPKLFEKYLKIDGTKFPNRYQKSF
jgi:hypothetical protein